MTDSATEVQRLLKEANAALRAGYPNQAHMLLRRIVELDPRNEQAWLWLSQVEDSLHGKREAFEQVLRINPSNAEAKQGLELLDHPPGTAVSGAQYSPPSSGAQNTTEGRKLPPGKVSAHMPARQYSPPVQRERRRWSLDFPGSSAVILIVGLLAICVGARVALDLMFPEGPPSNLPTSVPLDQTGQEEEPLFSQTRVSNVQPSRPSATNSPPAWQPGSAPSNGHQLMVLDSYSLHTDSGTIEKRHMLDSAAIRASATRPAQVHKLDSMLHSGLVIV